MLEDKLINKNEDENQENPPPSKELEITNQDKLDEVKYKKKVIKPKKINKEKIVKEKIKMK